MRSNIVKCGARPTRWDSQQTPESNILQSDNVIHNCIIGENKRGDVEHLPQVSDPTPTKIKGESITVRFIDPPALEILNPPKTIEKLV